MPLLSRKRFGRRAPLPRLASHGFAASVGTGVFSSVSGLVTLPIVLSTVGAGSYGAWLTVTTAVTLLYYADFGVGSAIVHFNARGRGGDVEQDPSEILSTAVVIVMGIWAVISAVSVLIFPLLVDSRLFSGLSHHDITMILVGFYVAFGGFLLQPYISTIVGCGLLVKERKYQLIASVFRVAATLVACLWFGSLGGVVISEAVALVLPGIFAMCSVVRLRLAVVSPRAFSRNVARRLWGYSYKRFLVEAIGAAVLQVGTLLVAYVGGPSSVSYYSAAFRIYLGVRQVAGWAIDPFRPTLSLAFVESKSAALRAVKAFSVFSAFGVWLISGFLLVTAGGVTTFWLGSASSAYDTAAMVVLLLLGFMINIIHIPLIVACDSAGYPGVFLVPQLAWLGLYIVLGWLLGASFGVVGVTAALGLSIATLEPYYLMIAARRLGFVWWRHVLSCLSPCFVVVGPSVILAALPLVVWHGQFVWALSGAIYWIIAVPLFYVSRRLLPMAEVRSALRLSL